MRAFFIKLLFIISIIFSIGCSKDDNDLPIEPTIDYGIIEATVSGLNTIPDHTVLEFEPQSLRIDNGVISIYGVTVVTYAAGLNLRIPDSINEPGLYTDNIGGSITEGWDCNPSYAGQTCWWQYLHNFHSLHNEVSIEILQMNEERIEGTFEILGCGLEGDVNLENGYFNILRI